ncbi:hypothetical protein V6N13_071267 [Hibiscus sabdariffa]
MGHELGNHDIQHLAETARNHRSSFRQFSSSFRTATSDLAVPSFRENNDDEVELQWAAIQRLPTYRRLRTSLFDHKLLMNDTRKEEDDIKTDRKREVIDVTELGPMERHVFMEKLITKIEDDNLRLLKKLKERIDRQETSSVSFVLNKVGLELSTIEVRFQNLSVEADCEVVQGKPIPTLWNTVSGAFSDDSIAWPSGMRKDHFVTGTFRKAQPISQGDISYNGYKFTEFVPQNTSAYISQYDLHISEMTVRETLDFSARYQGIGRRADMLKEISRREKQSGIVPEPDIDTFMKAISIEGLKGTLQTDYILKLIAIALITITIFIRTRMKLDLVHASYYLGSLFYALIRLLTIGVAELALTVSRLFFRQLFLLFLVHQMAVSLFRFIASVVRDPPFAANFSLFMIMVIFLFSGFIIPRPLLPAWVKWGFWLSPLAYAEIGVAINEFLAPRWQQVSSSNATLGQRVLEKHAVAAPGSSRAIISHERFSYLKAKEDSSDTAEEKELPSVNSLKAPAQTKVKGRVLPFKPITISFKDVQYFVDTPKLILMKKGGQMINSGELGQHSSRLIEYFEVIIEIPYVFLEAILFLTITYPAANFYGSACKVFWYFYTVFCTLLYYKLLGMMMVSLTPTYQVASIIANLCYTLFSLFSGYLIPGPKFPKWWVWGYWICPTSWSLKGIFISQYGDVKEEIVAFGEQKALNAFLDSQYGYKHQDLPIIAIVLLAYPLVFASVFAYGIAKLNYQRR